MRVIVTGGAGFIGCNAVKRHLEAGDECVVLDNLSRRGADKNVAWLQSLGRFAMHRCDIRDARSVDELFRTHRNVDVVLHLAGQVAVTSSVVDPRADFEANALGTFNLLEAARIHSPGAAFLYASTNKVYGGLEHVGVEEQNGRWQYRDLPDGVDEDEPLDFHSPYGCSKGAGDQYVRDYARIYGMNTVCFRQSCIYGHRQFGVEDQGWVAWFTIAASKRLPVSIYGDGKQTRDVLFVDDLLDCYQAAVRRIDTVRGQIFNVGGGPANVLSLHQLLDKLERLGGAKIERRYAEWRPGDQRVFVCDVRKAERELGWRPKTSIDSGIASLYDWVRQNSALFG
jgi:CDP-paratose 2-epimerase